MMTRNLVIPDTDTADTKLFHYRTQENGEDKLVPKLRDDGTQYTWQDVANESLCVNVYRLSDPWCVENAIDGLGICTEESGQESEAQRVAREAREAAELARQEAILDASAKVDAMLAKLGEKSILSSDDIARVTSAKAVSKSLHNLGGN